MTAEKSPPISIGTLADWVGDARQYTLALVHDLSDEQLRRPRFAVANPPLWEIGHMVGFRKNACLRRAIGRLSGRMRIRFTIRTSYRKPSDGI